MTSDTNSNAQPIRYHALDGLRASMMLLGIVFHVAWFFQPTYLGHPITDNSANEGFSVFFFWVHVFRMQAFFLIAGFFAHLLYAKRGWKSFIRQRLLRVGVPLVLGVLLMGPLMRLYYAWGGLISGRVQNSQGLLAQWLTSLKAITFETVPLLHLWFIYVLLILYVLTIAGLLIADRIVDRQGAIRKRLDTGFRLLVGSPYGIFLLAIPVAWTLSYDTEWFGLDTGNVIPWWWGVFGYLVFYSVGWMLYSHADLLPNMTANYRSQILIGSILASVLWSVHFVHEPTGALTRSYPMLTGGEVSDYPRFRQVLLLARDAGNTHSPGGRIWSRISPDFQQFIAQHDRLTTDQAHGLSVELNEKVLASKDFADPSAFSTDGLSLEDIKLLHQPATNRSIAQVPLLNRRLLESTLSGLFASRIVDQPRYQAGKIFFNYGYAVASWLLVFGFLGLFIKHGSHPSPMFRYFSDASYWMFLIHLPIQFQTEVLIAEWPLWWFWKCALHMVICFAIMIPSYHYLVRSTWVGGLLNGRRYPYQSMKRAMTRFPQESAPGSSMNHTPH